MSYDTVKADFVKEKFWIIELDLDYCDNTYGLNPCTASVGVTGNQKCFNTAKTCQDRANYIKSPKVYRFCTKRSPLPVGLNAIPSLASAPTISGTKINSGGGLGVRGGISLSFTDHPSSDNGIDKYVNERTYIPYDTGTYWGKLRARNPYYNNRTLKAFSGYLVDGVYDPANFQERTYVIENISSNRGVAVVKGKDVLKLADDERSQYPKQSTGQLSADITNSDTSFTLTPAGVGDLEYDASGWIRLSDEVVSFTRVADTVTIVRAQYNTAATSHSTGDSAQQCAYINDTVANIDYELLTVGAGVDPVFIDLPAWQSESDDNFPSFLETLITEPTGVKKLLKELGDNAPHFLYFDERTQLIVFNAVKQPPVNVNYINEQGNIKADSLKVADNPSARLSDVIVHFGQLDPTKKMNEPNNYAQKYIRSDLASSGVDEFGSKKIETIHSRWINNFNKSAAVDLAARKGRRFGITPREVSFTLFAKDSDYWVGGNLGIDHPALQTATGETGNNIFQITSVKEAGDFHYTALEYLYAEALPQDIDSGVNTIILGGNENNINLRDIYDNLFPSPDASTKVKFIIDSGVSIGSSNVTDYSILTGSWPAGMSPVNLLVRGYGQGKGGDASVSLAENGGPAISMGFDLTIEDVTGIIAGGGGAGGSAPEGGGGGGAGIDVGLNSFGGFVGTRTLGGSGAGVGVSDEGGDGGNMAMPGESALLSGVPGQSGGAAGIAINKNGYTLVIENGNTNILGVII